MQTFLPFFLGIMNRSFLLMFLAGIFLFIAVFSSMSPASPSTNPTPSSPGAPPSRRKIKIKPIRIVAILFMYFAIFNLIFGSRVAGALINHYGQEGSAVVIQEKNTNNTYNDQVVVRYDALLKTAEGETIETHFESWDFNLYPKPKGGGYTYPKKGIEFAVKYLPQNPHRFVILTQAPSVYAQVQDCQSLKVAMEKAQTKLDFAQENESYQIEYKEALSAYEESDCEEENDPLKEDQDR